MIEWNEQNLKPYTPGKPDHAKGSYYALTVADSITDNVKLKKEFPAIYSDNIWPREELPELETSFKQMTEVCHQCFTSFTSLASHFIWFLFAILSLSSHCGVLKVVWFTHPQIQMEVGYAMCAQFDRYLHKVTQGQHHPSTIYNMMKLGSSYKGRLLHYFPTKQELCNQQVINYYS